MPSILRTEGDDDQQRIAAALAGMTATRDRRLPSPAIPGPGPVWELLRQQFVPHLSDPKTYQAQPPPDITPNDAGKVPAVESDLRVQGVAADLANLATQGLGGPEAALAGGVGKLAAGAAKAIPTLIGRRAGYDPRLYHGLSAIKLSKPVSEMTFERVGVPPSKEVQISPEQLQGSVLLAALGDPTAEGGRLVSIGGRQLSRPVDLRGGHGFMSANDPQVWASQQAQVKTLLDRARPHIEKGVPVNLVYSAQGLRSSDFGTHVSDAIADLVGQGGLGRTAVADVNTRMREPFGKKTSRSGEVKYDFPAYGSDVFPGVRSPNLFEALREGSGNMRTKLAQALDTRPAQEGGFPDMAEVRNAVTDQRLVNEPQGASGLSIARLDPRLLSEPSTHPAFPVGVLGQYLGGLGVSVPREAMFPDQVAAYLARPGVRGEQDLQRTFLMGTQPNFQPANQRWLENIMPIWEQLKGLQK